MNNIDKPLETPGATYWKNVEEHFYKMIPSINLSEYELTEDEAGRLFVDLFQYYIRYNKTISGYMIYTGSIWTPDKWNIVERAAALTSKFLQSVLAELPAASLKEAANFVKHLRTVSGTKAILFFASSDPRVTTSQEDYDKDPHLLNTPDYTIDLRTGEARDHKREDLFTKQTLCNPDSICESKIFSSFLRAITLGRADLQIALQTLLGSGCSGRYPKEEIGLFFGGGSNGKTVLLEACGDVLGDYTKTLDIKNITEFSKESAGHNDSIAHLTGGRLCITSESNQDIKMDTAKIKKMTGGDKIPVSFKHGRTFDMRPCFTLIILTNHKPRITNRDDGTWRRARLFPFDYKIPEESKDLEFKQKMLEADAPYILNWLIQGCRSWYESGYYVSETVTKATEEYKKQEDIIGTFIDECCKTDKGFSVSGSTLRDAYQKWAEENGEHIFSNRAWKQALEEHGFTRSRGMYGSTWKGLCLKSESTI